MSKIAGLESLPPRVGGAADTRGFSIVVAASTSLDPTLAPAVYRCDGVADQVEWDAAIVVLNAVGGGTAIGLNGTFNLTVATITGLAYVAIRGQGYGTLFYVANGVFINAITFASRQYWMVKDLRIDGNYTNNADQGSEDNQNGVYVDGDVVHYALISGVWIVNCRRSGVRGKNGDVLIVSDSTFDADQRYAIYHSILERGIALGCVVRCPYGIASGTQGIVANCVFWGCNTYGIVLVGYGVACGNHMYAAGNGVGIYVPDATGAVVVSNEIRVVNTGIYILGGWSINITVVGNTIYDPLTHGIRLTDESHDNNVSCNNIYQAGANSEGISLDNSDKNSIKCNHVYGGARDGIRLANDSDQNDLFGNSCRENTGYGINISAATCNLNIVRENDLRGNTAGAFNCAAPDTITQAIEGSFIQAGGGSGGWIAPVINTSPGGIDLDADDEFAYDHKASPKHIQMVWRVTVWAYSNVAEAVNNMLLRIVINAGGSSEPWNTENVDVANVPSQETGGIAVNDVINWAITAADDADLDDILAGDFVEIMAVGEAAAAPDVATDALFGGYLIEYV